MTSLRRGPGVRRDEYVETCRPESSTSEQERREGPTATYDHCDVRTPELPRR